MLGFARSFALIVLLPVAALAGDVQPGEVARLNDVVVVNDQDATTILLKTSAPARYLAEFMDSPWRLVVDFQDTTLAWRNTPLKLSDAPLRQVRGSQYRKGVARVVIEFTRKAGYVITEEADGIAIAVPKSPATPTTVRAPVVRPTPAPRPAITVIKPAPAPKLVETKPAETSVAAAPVPKPADTGAATGAEPKAPEPAVSALPARASTPPLLGTESVQPAPLAEIERKPPALPELRVAQAPTTPAPRTTSGNLISLDFKDADVVNLLRILAAESGKNIVIGEDVKGKMSITLRNVPWEQALDIILEAKDLRKVEKGNVLRIITSDQLAKERESAARLEEARVKAEEARGKADAEIRSRAAEAQIKEQEARQKQVAAQAAIEEQQARGPLREETIRLAYADPDDVAKTLQGLLGITGAEAAPAAPAAPFSAVFGPGVIAAPPAAGPPSELLAKGITIRAHKPTNSIFIRHYDKDIERIKRLIRETLDVQLPQIKIEARLNELNRSDLFSVGVQWGGAAAGRDSKNVLVGFGNATAPAGSAGTSPPIDPFGSPTVASRVPLTGFLPVSATTGLPAGGNIVNLPVAGAPTAGIGFGIIGTRFSLSLALQALESQAKTRSLSRPEIVTVENAKASISLGSEIPYATVSSAGTQVQFKEAVLKLEVTPTVIREPDATKIKMKVAVEDNSRGIDVPSGSAGGTLPTINKRKAETEVVVKEGESLVIGGIAQRTESDTISKVPLFGDIPVLGWMFKNRNYSLDPNRELVIFITPTVLRDAPRATGPTVPPVR